MLGITKDIKSLSALNWEVLKSEKKNSFAKRTNNFYNIKIVIHSKSTRPWMYSIRSKLHTLKKKKNK